MRSCGYRRLRRWNESAPPRLCRIGAAPDQQHRALPLQPPLCFLLDHRQRSLSGSLFSLASLHRGPKPWPPAVHGRRRKDLLASAASAPSLSPEDAAPPPPSPLLRPWSSETIINEAALTACSSAPLCLAGKAQPAPAPHPACYLLHRHGQSPW